MECRILENNPAGLNRAEIERVVGNQYNRLLRQQQASKALSASKGTVTANREKGKNRRLHHKFDGKCFNCGKKGHRAVDCRSAKKKSEKSGATDDRKEGGGSGRCYICGSEDHLAHRHCGLCKSLEHRTRDCEERGAKKGAMLAKLTVPVVPEVREVTAMVWAARSVRKEEWESDSGATFHMSHTRAGMSAYKKASPGTNVEIADGNILPVDGFGRIELDLDQPGRTTKMVKMDDVAYVPGLSRNLRSTVKAVEQWGKPLICYRNKAVLGFPGEESLVFKFCPRRRLFSATGARRIPRQEVTPEEANGLVKIASGTALGMRAGASRDVMEVHRMLAHPSEDITRKTAEMMGIETTGQWGACETCFQAKAKRHAVPKKTDERASVRTRKIVERQAVQWVDGPKKTGGDDTGSDDRGMKSAGDGTIVERGTPQLNVQELGQEQQLTLHEHETQEAFGTCSDDRGMKSAGDGTIIKRGTPQLNVQELGQEQQVTLHEHETQGAFGTDSDDRGRWNHCQERCSAARSTGAGAGAAAGVITRTQKGSTRGAARPRTEDTRGAAGSRRGDMEGAIGSQGRDTRGPTESRGRATGGAIGPLRGDMGSAMGPRRGDMGSAMAPRKGDTRGAFGPQRGDTGGVVGSHGSDTGGAIGSRGRGTGDAVVSRRGDTGGAVGS